MMMREGATQSHHVHLKMHFPREGEGFCILKMPRTAKTFQMEKRQRTFLGLKRLPVCQPLFGGPTMVLISRVSVPRATAKKNTQIRLAFVFLHAGWEPIEVRALIDTGAEVSLVRQGLFPPSFFKISPVPLKILGANEHRDSKHLGISRHLRRRALTGKNIHSISHPTH